MADMLREFRINGTAKPNWSKLMDKMETTVSLSKEDAPGKPGEFTGCVKFTDPSFEEIAGDTLAGGTKLEMRQGIDKDTVSPWGTYVIIDTDVKYLPGRGAEVLVYFRDASVRMNLDSRFKTYDGKTFSDIVTDLAKVYSLPAAVTEGSSVTDTYVQGGVTDWEFLSSYFSAQSRKKDGVGGYRLFFKDGAELHFHPPDYAQKPYRTFNIHGSSSVYFFMRMNPYKKANAGGESVTVVGIERDTLEPFGSTFDNTKLSGTYLGTRELAPVSEANRTGALAGNVVAGFSTKVVAGQQAAGIFGMAFNDAQLAELKWVDDPKLDVGQLVYIDTTIAGKTLIGEGLWLVERIHRTLTRSSGEMVVTLTRPTHTAAKIGIALSGITANPANVGSKVSSPTAGKDVASFDKPSGKQVTPTPV